MSSTWEQRGSGTAQAVVAPPHCPACDAVLDGLGTTTQGDTEPVVPEPGAVTICMVCTSILQFGAELQVELMPRTRWLEDFRDEDRSHLEGISVLCAKTAPLAAPTTWIAWHGAAWYALSIWPNRLDPMQNLLVRSQPHDTREPLDRLKKKGMPLTMIIGQAGLDPLVGRWRYTVHMQSITFGWRHMLEVSAADFVMKEAAQEASVAACNRLKEQYAVGPAQVLHSYRQQPRGPLS